MACSTYPKVDFDFDLFPLLILIFIVSQVPQLSADYHTHPSCLSRVALLELKPALLRLPPPLPPYLIQLPMYLKIQDLANV